MVATVILSGPIFQGLAIALMAGSLISMFTAPVLGFIGFHFTGLTSSRASLA